MCPPDEPRPLRASSASVDAAVTDRHTHILCNGIGVRGTGEEGSPRRSAAADTCAGPGPASWIQNPRIQGKTFNRMRAVHPLQDRDRRDGVGILFLCTTVQASRRFHRAGVIPSVHIVEHDVLFTLVFNAPETHLCIPVRGLLLGIQIHDAAPDVDLLSFSF